MNVGLSHPCISYTQPSLCLKTENVGLFWAKYILSLVIVDVEQKTLAPHMNPPSSPQCLHKHFYI